MTHANREDFLAAVQSPARLYAVELPLLGKTVHVKKFSVKARTWFESRLSAGQKLDPENPLVRSLAIVAGVTDESGKPLFSADDLEWIQESDFELFEPAVEKCLEIGNLAAAGVKETAKNSVKTSANGHSAG
jgi:hypothetical protein